MIVYSVKLVEQELWQREEKGLIGVLPVRDSEAVLVGSVLSPGDLMDMIELTLFASLAIFNLYCLILGKES